MCVCVCVCVCVSSKDFHERIGRLHPLVSKMGGNEEKFRVMGTCNEARRGQDSEGGCDGGYESGKQSKVSKRPGDRLGEVWMDRFGHRSPEWVTNE